MTNQTKTHEQPVPVEPNKVASQEADLVLCPGQGAQHVGMGKSWFDRSDAAKETYKIADEALSFELSRLSFEGPAETLNRTDLAQAAIYVASIASYRALEEAGSLGTLGAVAGLSLGEFTALHLAGAFDFVSGLKLVRLRGQAMQQAADTTPGGSGMVALTGADEELAKLVCEQAVKAVGEGVLVPANYNCPGQVVISGSQGACDAAVTVAEKMSLRATPLSVAGAFHSPLMQPAAEKLQEAIENVDWAQPTVPVLSNVTANPHDAQNIDSIKSRLIDQLTSPVRWSESMQWMIGQLRGRYIELAPGKVLTGLMRRIDRSAKVTNFAEPQ